MSDVVSANVAMLSRPKHAAWFRPGEIIEFDPRPAAALREAQSDHARPESCPGCGAPFRGSKCDYCRRVRP